MIRWLNLSHTRLSRNDVEYEGWRYICYLLYLRPIYKSPEPPSSSLKDTIGKSTRKALRMNHDAEYSSDTCSCLKIYSSYC